MAESSSLSLLPNEVLSVIVNCMSNAEIKTFRATSRQFNFVATPALRFDRIYLSPAKRNIIVFNAIVTHDLFRESVFEIVYDDALLVQAYEEESRAAYDILDSEYFYDMDFSPHPADFLDECSPTYGSDASSAYSYLSELIKDASNDPEEWYRQKHREMFPFDQRPYISLQDSCSLYRQLYREQVAIIEDNADLEALQRAIALLPNLKRVTITPETYYPDWTISRHHTPLMGSFPPGFRMPRQRVWSGNGLEKRSGSTHLTSTFRSVVSNVFQFGGIATLMDNSSL